MTKPHFNIEYNKGPEAPFVDWIAGGNFDGYISKESMIFFDSNKQVLIRKTIIDQSRYDGEVSNSERWGTFEYTSKDTITVKYGEVEMRGKILGDKREYIVFDIFKPQPDFNMAKVYELK